MPEAGGWPGIFVMDSCEVADIVGEWGGDSGNSRDEALSEIVKDIPVSHLTFGPSGLLLREPYILYIY